MDKRKLAIIEQSIFDLFRAGGTNKMLASEVFALEIDYANADLVRAFEDMEKRGRLLIRYTEEGDDWIHLTPEGTKRAGLSDIGSQEQPHAMPHPPKSST